MTTTTTNTAAASLSDRLIDDTSPQAEAAPKKASLDMVARLIVDHYASEPDDYVISIGDLRNDPILGAPMREFVAYLQMPLGDFRAAIAAGGAQEAIYQVMVGEKWVDSTAAEYAAVSNEKRIVYAAPLHRVAATVPFQQRVQPWMMECFGPVIADDRMERNHRFFEEATELVQACGMTASEAHQLVDYTFSRPVGEPSQEVGGVMVTLAALCLANRLDMHDSGETELARINVPETVAKIRAKQAAKPKHSPLPAGPAASNGEQG